MDQQKSKLGQRVFTVFYTGIVTIVLVGIVAVVGQIARATIEQNRLMMKRRAIVEVAGLLPEGDVSAEKVNQLFEAHFPDQSIPDDEDPARMNPTGGKDLVVLKAVDPKTGELLCYVFKTEGMGYWDQIVGYVAVEPDGKTLRGVIFTEHKETPGLGGEITNPEWRSQFSGKTFETEVKPKVYVSFEKPGTADKPSEIDAISGATRTSDAVEDFFNEDLAQFKTWYQKNAHKEKK